MNPKIKYWDAAATTPVDERVLEAMLPYFSEIFGNASSNHIYGKTAKNAIEIARSHVADLINSDKKEIYFTSGATEAINWGLKGYLEANPEKGNHIITVKTEHKAVLSTCEYLESKGYEVTYLEVDKNGLINLEELESNIRTNTALISVMYVNNEIGIIQDIPVIGEIARKNEVVFFCDATQALGKIPVDVEADNIDMLAMSAHKFNGPKGVGSLFIRNGIKISPLLHGGGQENGLRAGTYNTPLIVGLGEASRIAKVEFNERIEEIIKKRAEIEEYFVSNNYGTINFNKQKTAPHILSVTLNGNDAEDFLLEKSQEFVASTGSACNSRLITSSYVFHALFKNEKTQSIIRLSVNL
ncbi:MAG: cysteine desulfurase family protein [Bacteroidota bacterium]